MQFLPSIPLRPFIRHYLAIASPNPTSIRFFSDGNPGIVFCTGQIILNAEILPSSFAYGQITHYKDLTFSGNLLIVVFRPYGLHALTGIPSTELKDQFIDLQHLFKIPPTAQNIDQYLQAQVQHTCTLTKATIDYIDQQKGNLTLSQLQTFTGYHERHIERRFKTSAGISPATYCNLVRTHTFLKSLKKHEKITPTVFETGYYDQSHAIKSFKKLTGLTPRHYLYKSLPLASNFLSRNCTI